MFQDDSEPWSIQQLFSLLDHNNDGHIDAHDLAALCSSTARGPMNEVMPDQLLTHTHKMVMDPHSTQYRILLTSSGTK